MPGALTKVLTLVASVGLAQAAFAADPVKVGVALELSGRFVAFGSHCKRGIDMASEVIAKEFPEPRIEFVYRDVESNASSTVSAFTELASQQKLNYIIGPAASPIVSSAIPAWRQAKPIWIVVGASTVTLEKEIGSEPNLFHPYPYAYHYHIGLSAMLKDYVKDNKTVALIYSDDDYGRTHLPLAKKYLEGAGFKIVGEEVVRANSPDMNPALTKIAFAKPEIMMALMQTTDAITLAKQAYTRRLKVPFLIGTAATQLKEWQDAVGDAQDSWVGLAGYLPDLANYPASKDFPRLMPSTHDWELAFRGKYKEEPNYDDALCYTSAAVLAIAINRVGSDDKEKVAEALRKIDMSTVYGPFKWEPTEGGTRQNALSDMIIFQRQAGKNVTVFPRDVATGSLRPQNR